MKINERRDFAGIEIRRLSAAALIVRRIATNHSDTEIKQANRKRNRGSTSGENLKSECPKESNLFDFSNEKKNRNYVLK